MDKRAPPTSFGVLKPVGHVMLQFCNLRDVEGAAEAIQRLGVPVDDMALVTPRQMLQHIDQELASAGAAAPFGQELNITKARRAAAERGHHWLVVYAPAVGPARRIAAAAQSWHAERAQHYGRFIIEELIEHDDDLSQVAESPDRGLDAQTLSGTEEERLARHARR